MALVKTDRTPETSLDDTSRYTQNLLGNLHASANHFEASWPVSAKVRPNLPSLGPSSLIIRPTLGESCQFRSTLAGDVQSYPQIAPKRKVRAMLGEVRNGSCDRLPSRHHGTQNRSELGVTDSTRVTRLESVTPSSLLCTYMSPYSRMGLRTPAN